MALPQSVEPCCVNSVGYDAGGSSKLDARRCVQHGWMTHKRRAVSEGGELASAPTWLGSKLSVLPLASRGLCTKYHARNNLQILQMYTADAGRGWPFRAMLAVQGDVGVDD
eukprot:1036763-Pelagomonas_calceolata.AAC.3